MPKQHTESLTHEVFCKDCRNPYYFEIKGTDWYSLQNKKLTFNCKHCGAFWRVIDLKSLEDIALDHKLRLIQAEYKRREQKAKKSKDIF